MENFDILLILLLPVDASPTPDGCVVAFTAVPNKSAQGGALQNGVTTLEACTDACRAQTTCVGFDWTKATVTDSCWFFTDLALMTANTDNNGVDQYLRGANCDGEPNEIKNETHQTSRYKYVLPNTYGSYHVKIL